LKIWFRHRFRGALGAFLGGLIGLVVAGNHAAQALGAAERYVDLVATRHPEILDAGIFGDAAAAKPRTLSTAFAAVPRRGANLDPCVRSAPLVVFEDVAFRYDLSRPDAPFAVEGVTLRLEAGKSTALVGASGSGKSSLAKLLLRLHDPERGRVLVDGVPLDALDVLKHRRRVGIVQQEPSLFDRTIYENIAYGMEPPPSRAKVAAAAFAAGVDAVIAALKDGYDTPAGEKSTRLSGGEKQRVALARALVREPTLMLLDEATSALDAESERAVQDALDALIKECNITVMVVAHRLSTVRDADTICVMKRGVLVEEGSHDELFARDGGVYADLVRRQANISKEDSRSLLSTAGSESSLPSAAAGAN